MRLTLKNSVRADVGPPVEGCCHGELDKIYEHIETLERKHSYKVDLLLICGDFQAIRNHADLQCMAVPQKYRKLGGFYKYYLGQRKAPILTIVIGGNHEASNYMWELYHGGWLAPSIYFLGFSGCVQVNGIRIAGSSGIYKSNDYILGHHEKVPYDNSSIRSIYHTRLFDILKLSHFFQLSPPDIFLSHDWPNTIEQHGDLQSLLRRKPFFRQEAQTGTLGSPPLLDLLQKIKPQWWFSAHLHTKFEAIYRHDGDRTKPSVNPDEIMVGDLDDADFNTPIENPDEIKIDDDEDLEVEPSAPPNTKAPSLPEDRPAPRETRFLALDKCLPKRDFLQPSDPPRLTFDPEWLAITRALHPFFCTTRDQATLPKPDDTRALIAAELEWVRQNITDGGSKDVSEIQSFWRTAPGPPAGDMTGQNRPPSWYTNPQTEAFARLLEIPNKVNPVPPGMAPKMVQGAEADAPGTGDQETTTLELEKEVSEGDNAVEGSSARASSGGKNDDPPVTYPDEPITSGRWSPSRLMD
ncbi:lariat debranching enzyme, C-terminal domain-containing protein [Gautieria morchelliformis]|nr:lariat debranching enzyme, C-terminal domain-containing protein [Gautieria morchelliformis]